MDLQTLRVRIAFLSTLRGLLQKPMLTAYQNVLSALSEDILAFGQAYGALCDHLYRTGDAGEQLQQLIACDDNALTLSLNLPQQAAVDAATRDLETLSALISLSGRDLLGAAQLSFPDALQSLSGLPDFAGGKALPFTDGQALVNYYRENGFGFFAKAISFTAVQDGQICPVSRPDSIKLGDLKGYARQKNQVITNTLAFLEGWPANNILLYGDKGTGKSSTVKAVVNAYADRGLRIIELTMQQIGLFSELCEQVARSPYRIILFLDDLSFEHDDESFSALKAFIEGGLAGKPENMIIYATSNRRHLVRESFSDRMGDDIHWRDTMETITALSDRFGLEITFSVPDKDEYLSIVDQLAEEYGLDLPQERLHLLAERFALRRGGRSPRTARQFLSHQKTQQ